ATEQAPLRVRAELGTIERAGRAGRRRAFVGGWVDAHRAQRRVARDRFRLHSRNLAVLGVEDDRASLLAVDGDQLVPLREPEVVVAADHAAAELLEEFEVRLGRRVLAADRRRAAVRIERRIVLDFALSLVG